MASRALLKVLPNGHLLHNIYILQLSYNNYAYDLLDEILSVTLHRIIHRKDVLWYSMNQFK